MEIALALVALHNAAFFEQVLFVGAAGDLAIENLYPLEFTETTAVGVACGLGVAECFQDWVGIRNQFLRGDAYHMCMCLQARGYVCALRGESVDGSLKADQTVGKK